MKKFRLRDYLPVLIMVLCAVIFGVLLATGVMDLDTVPQLVADRPVLAVLVVLGLYVLKGFSGVVVYNALVVVVSMVLPLPAALAVNGVGTAVCLSISYAMGRFTKTESLESVLDRHPKIKRYFSATASLTMEDGEMTDLFDMNAVHVLPAPDPEENAVQRDLLARLLQSDEDRSIAGRMAEGLTVREIAAALGMSKSAVQRRIDHIRNRARLLASA